MESQQLLLKTEVVIHNSQGRKKVSGKINCKIHPKLNHFLKNNDCFLPLTTANSKTFWRQGGVILQFQCTIFKKALHNPCLTSQEAMHIHTARVKSTAQPAIHRAQGPLASGQQRTERQRLCTVSTHFY